MIKNATTKPGITSAWAKAAIAIRQTQLADALTVIRDYLNDNDYQFALVTPFDVSFTPVGEISDKGIVPFDPDSDMTPAERAAENDGRGWDALNLSPRDSQPIKVNVTGIEPAPFYFVDEPEPPEPDEADLWTEEDEWRQIKAQSTSTEPRKEIAGED